MDINAVRTIARQELVVSIRNRWTLVFASVFGVLVLSISYFGLVTGGAVGFQGFARTSASLLNMVLYIVPLVSLTMGTLSFTSEKSSSELLFAQPITRGEILLGKLLGLFVSILTAMLIGFGIGGIVIASQAGTEGSMRYPGLVGFSLLLALIFLSLSAFISTLCRRKTKAFGVALFVWFFFVLFYDLLVIGLAFVLKEHAANLFIFGSLFGNPVDMMRVASLMTLNGTDIFGPGGAALLRFLGGERLSVTLLVTALSFWAIAPLVGAQKLLKHQDI